MEFAAKLGAFFAVILAGAWAGRRGLLKQEARQALSWICLHLTLPAAILSGFSPTQARSLLFVTPVALLLAACPFALGLALARAQSPVERACAGISMAGYNIGSFTLPLAQAFLGPQAVTVICLFDIGNAFISCGGSYALAGCLVQTRGALGGMWRRLRGSAPFWANLFMLALALGGLQLPAAVLALLAPAAQANGFISMFLLGLLLGGARQEGGGRPLWRFAAARAGWAAAAAGFCLAVLPGPPQVRQVMAMVCFSPISMLAPVYTELCGGPASRSSRLYFAYFPFSICMLCLCLWRLSG